MPQPLSYRAAANVDITIKGSDPENALDLMGHKETGKTGCHPIETSFDATLAWMVKNQDPPTPSADRLYPTQVTECTDERYCVHFFSEKNYKGRELIF